MLNLITKNEANALVHSESGGQALFVSNIKTAYGKIYDLDRGRLIRIALASGVSLGSIAVKNSFECDQYIEIEGEPLVTAFKLLEGGSIKDEA